MLLDDLAVVVVTTDEVDADVLEVLHELHKRLHVRKPDLPWRCPTA